MATQAKNARNRAPVAPIKPEGDKPQALHVTPKVPGFRRAGRAFPDGETVIPIVELDDEEYVQLTTEPMLVTYVKDLPAAEPQAN